MKRVRNYLSRPRLYPPGEHPKVAESLAHGARSRPSAGHWVGQKSHAVLGRSACHTRVRRQRGRIFAPSRIEHDGCYCLRKQLCGCGRTTGGVHPPARSQILTRMPTTRSVRSGAQETHQLTHQLTYQPPLAHAGGRRLSSALSAGGRGNRAAPTARTGPMRSWARQPRCRRRRPPLVRLLSRPSAAARVCQPCPRAVPWSRSPRRLARTGRSAAANGYHP